MDTFEGANLQTGNGTSNAHGRKLLNPFVQETNLSTKDKLQILLMTLTVFPVRLVLLMSSLTLAWLFASLTVYGRSKIDAKFPIVGFRLWLKRICVFFSRCVLFFGGLQWITVKGRRSSSAEAPILVTASHSSYADVFSMVYLGLLSVVAKSGTENIPFIGVVCKAAEPILVEREDPNSRRSAAEEIRRRAKTNGQWPQVFVFAEGTCTNRRSLIGFKTGAFLPGVPVQPLCVRYKNKLDTTIWTWNGMGAMKSMWLTMCQIHINVEMEFLPIYQPTEEEKADPYLFASNVRAVMAKALRVPTTEHLYEDAFIMSHAMTLGIPIAPRLVNVNLLVRQLGINHESILEQLCNRCQLNFQVHLKEFAQLLNVSETLEPLQQLFGCYTPESSNSLDLRHFVLELYLLGRPTSVDDVVSFASKVYDHGNKGHWSESELSNVTALLGENNIKSSKSSPCEDKNSGQNKKLK